MQVVLQRRSPRGPSSHEILLAKHRIRTTSTIKPFLGMWLILGNGEDFPVGAFDAERMDGLLVSSKNHSEMRTGFPIYSVQNEHATEAPITGIYVLHTSLRSKQKAIQAGYCVAQLAKAVIVSTCDGLADPVGHESTCAMPFTLLYPNHAASRISYFIVCTRSKTGSVRWKFQDQAYISSDRKMKHSPEPLRR